MWLVTCRALIQAAVVQALMHDPILAVQTIFDEFRGRADLRDVCRGATGCAEKDAGYQCPPAVMIHELCWDVSRRRQVEPST